LIINNKKDMDLNERIFIAGANGMVGSAIKRALVKKNYGKENNEVSILSPLRKELDLTDFIKVEEWFAKFKPTIVIISAAKVGGIYANSKYPYEFILENLKIQTNLIEISYKYKIKKLLFLGSSCIYPKFAKQPIKEEYLLTGNLEKSNEFYAIAKIAGLKLCEALKIQYGFDAISLMPTNLYGPGDNYHPANSHVLPALIRKFEEAKREKLKKVVCWGTGNPLREFLFVDDLAEACIFILENWDKAKNISQNNENQYISNLINVGSEYEISIKELANLISKKFAFDGFIEWDSSKPDGTPRKKLDTTKINKLGWKAQTSLEVGISKTINKYFEDLELRKLRI
tara:strand:+ start:3649 stop:4677 length:1029 start_codon:yes stop_codon:yes gene_type:complete